MKLPHPSPNPRYREFRDALAAHPEWLAPWRGCFFRFQTIQFPTAKDILSGAGARHRGGRWNPPGIASIYGSTTDTAALEEAKSNDRYYGLETKTPRIVVAISAQVGSRAALARHSPQASRGLGCRLKKPISKSESKLPPPMALTPQEITEALAGFSVVEPAPRLLRFFSPQGLPLLTHGTLRVTPPKEFNDPFEFYAATLKVPPTVAQMRGWLMAENSFLRHGYEMNHRKDYAEWVEKVALKESEHWPSSLRSMSVGYAEAISRSYGVCCFMELTNEQLASPEIVHFWDRYADNHRGFVVAFNTGTGLLEPIRQEKLLFPVNYHSEHSRPVVDPGELTTDDAAMVKYLRKIAAEKFETWKAEREWRLIASLSDDPKNPVLRQVKGDKILYFLDLWRYVPPEHQGKEIVAVYLGSRASSDLVESVVAACSQKRLAHVSVFRAKPSGHDYSFSYELLK